MVNNGNWFAVSRLIFDHYVVGIRGRPYTEFEAWLWLLAQANYEQKTVINKGETVVLDPGQMMHARIYLSQVWDWTEDKVRWFLKRLEHEAMITRFIAANTQRKANQIQIITICNYSQYQLSRQQEEAAQHPAMGTPSDVPRIAPETHPTNTQQDSIYDNDLEVDASATTPSQHPAPHPALPPKDNNTKQSNNNNNTPQPPKGGKRGSRLPSDWFLPAEWRQAAREQFDIPEQRITTEANSFRDYWLGEAGQKASKVDWSRAWMNWIRRNYPERAGLATEKYWWQDPVQVAATAKDLARWRNGINRYANGMWSLEKLGPPPGHPKCIVPQAIIAELRLLEIYTPAGIKRQ